MKLQKRLNLRKGHIQTRNPTVRILGPYHANPIDVDESRATLCANGPVQSKAVVQTLEIIGEAALKSM